MQHSGSEFPEQGLKSAPPHPTPLQMFREVPDFLINNTEKSDISQYSRKDPSHMVHPFT